MRGKCSENTEKYQTYPSGGLGSTKFTVGLDDQPKRFYNSIMVFQLREMTGAGKREKEAAE